MEEISLSMLTGRDIWMLATAIACTVFIFDDIIVDLLAFFKGKKAKEITPEQIKKMMSQPERKISILTANWQEQDIIERIVAGNIGNIRYSNYDFILGVYPNDTATLEAARRVEKRFKNVTVVVNTKNGPTSKGQMLNVMVDYLKSQDETGGFNKTEAILIQDSEDIIHPYALKHLNMNLNDYDFVQTPVFSLEIPLTKLTAGIYIDEFIEAHTKDLLVRDHYKAGIPSAGVGTGMTWKAVKKVCELQGGKFLNENTLTEDYHLGLTCHDLNIKSHFACDYFEVEDKESGERRREYIATREYFPDKVIPSIKQKTRWSLGISLQGFEERKWKSVHAFERYFLWRDRKSLINAPLFTSALIFTIYMCLTFINTGDWPSLDYTPLQGLFVGLMWANLMFSFFRIINRMRLVSSVYGIKTASLVPVRWILSNFINTSCTYNAVYQWSSSKLSGEMPAWAKTEHMIPMGFGLDNKVILENEIPAQPTQQAAEQAAQTENRPV